MTDKPQHDLDTIRRSPMDPKMNNIEMMRAVAVIAERNATRWEHVARNLAQTVPDGAAILVRQMIAHGLIESAPTDAEGPE